MKCYNLIIILSSFLSFYFNFFPFTSLAAAARCCLDRSNQVNISNKCWGLYIYILQLIEKVEILPLEKPFLILSDVNIFKTLFYIFSS